jgi:hypothetical protein
MTDRPEHDSGDEALRREVDDATLDEQRRNDRLTRRWRRFVSNLRDLSDGARD